MIISNIPVFDAVILITVFAHEDTNNFIFTKYWGYLFKNFEKHIELIKYHKGNVSLSNQGIRL